MNTNNNAYTVIYTAIVVVAVAAVLAFTAMKLGPSQTDNAKAETLRQMMTAAQIAPGDEIAGMKNAEVIDLYTGNIESAFTIGPDGRKTADLGTGREDIELIDNLKPQDKAIKAGSDATLPVYVFKGGISVIPVYGAGLWGPVWGYIAIEPDGCTIKGAYFDHDSETPGLGAKIKDEPWFREKFIGKKIAFGGEPVFNISKNAEKGGADNAIDAITGATMTSNGLNQALNVWFKAYAEYFASAAQSAKEEE